MATATAALLERSASHKLAPGAFDNYALVTPFGLPKFADDFVVDEVPTKLLQVDYSYARPLTQARMRKLESMTFDHMRAGVLLVSMRNNGDFFLIDGQGRFYLAVNGSVATLPCRIYIDLTVEQESELYLAFNRDRSATTQLDDFRARLRAKEIRALAIQDVLDSFGIKVARGNQRHGKALQAIGCVEKIFSLFGADSLRYTLRTTLEIWPGTDAALNGDILLGMAAFFARLPKLEAQSKHKFDYQMFVERLAPRKPAAMKGYARAQQEDRPGMSKEIAMGRAILAIYDSGRRNRFGGWPERVVTEENMAVRRAAQKKAQATVAAKKKAKAAATPS